LNDTSDEPNWGCRATSRALRELLEETHPHADIRPVSLRALHHAPRPLRRLVTAYAASILPGDRPGGRGGGLLERWVLKRLFGGLRPEEIERVVLNGEGSTHGFRGQTLRVLLPIHLSQTRLGLWTAAVNQTVAAPDDRAQRLFRTVYGQARYLAVREPLSHRTLIDLGLAGTQLAADAAFRLEPAPPAEVEAHMRALGLEPGFVAISGSAIVEAYPLEAHRALVRRLSERSRGRIAFLAATNADRRRVALLGDAASLPVIPPTLSPAAVAGLLGQASLFLSGRFHLLIFAAIAGTPFVPLASNSFKIEGLLQSLAYPVPVSGPDDPVDLLLDRVVEVERNHEALQNRLRAAAPEMRERATFNVAFPGTQGLRT
jgi:polysaccharide pyruvyl transferase WcaK-like protein